MDIITMEITIRKLIIVIIFTNIILLKKKWLNVVKKTNPNITLRYVTRGKYRPRHL